MKKAIRLALVLLGILSFIIISILVIIKLLFPAQELKRIAENKLEEILNRTVNIEMIQFNPLSGIELTNINIGDKDLLLFSAKKISLLYDFEQLFSKKLVINQISIHKPVIKLSHLQNQWNVPLLKSGIQLENISRTAINKKIEIPVLPFDINLKAFIVKDLFLSINYNNNIAAEFSGLNLFLTGRLSSSSYNINAKISGSPESIFSFKQTDPKEIRFRSTINNRLNITFQNLDAIPIKGELKFNNLSAFYQDPFELNQLSIGLDLLLNIEKKKILFNKINIASNDFFNLLISGEIHRIFKQPKFNLILTDSFIDLKKSNEYISTLIPDWEVEGHLGINNIRLAGSLQNENKLDLGVQGSLPFDNINIARSKPNLSLKNASGTIKLNKLNLKNNSPEKFDAEIKLHLDNFISKTVSLKGFRKDAHIFSSEKTSDELIMKYDMQFEEIKLNIKNQPPIAFPFDVEGSLVSNLASLDIKNSLAEWNLPGVATGKFTAAYFTSDHNRFSVNNMVDLDLVKIKKYITSPHLKKIDQFNLSGKLTSNVKLSGQLNDQYLPENIKFKVNNNLKNIHARQDSLQIFVNGLNTKSTAKGQYEKKEGIEFAELELKGNFTNAKISDQIIVKKSDYSLAVKNVGPLNLNNLSGITSNIPIKIKSNSGESNSFQANLNESMDMLFNAITLKEKFSKNLEFTFDMSMKKIQLAEYLFSDKVKIAFNAGPPSKDTNNQQIDLNLKSEGVRFDNKNQIDLNNNVTAHLLFLFNEQNKSITIKKAGITSLPLFSISLRKGIINSEKKFNAQDLNIFFDMNHIWDKIPLSYRKIIPAQNLSGTIRINTNAEGIVASKINIRELDIPFKFNSKLNISKMALELKEHNLKINNMNSITKINNLDSNIISVSGSTEIGSVIEDFQSILPKLSDIHFQYDYSLKDVNTLDIKKSILNINDGLISQSLSGVIEGFNPMLTQNVPINASEILNRIKLKLNSGFFINKKKKLSLTSPIKFSGGLGTNVVIGLTPEEKLSLNGNIEFKDFTLKKDDFHIKNITGNIPIKKSYLFINENINQPLKLSNKFISQSGLFSDLRSYSKHKDLISIGSVQEGKHSLKRILLDLYLDNNQFAVEQFHFELEGGTVLGNMYFLPDVTAYKLSLNTNFASIDLEKILKIKSTGKKNVDSKVGGNAELIITLSPETKTTDFKFDQIETNLNITHIGENALDQLLIFFDPTESNPSMADLKDKLRAAKPLRINIKLKNERLSMFVRLKTHLTESGILDIQVLNRIPVQRLKQFSLFEENLKNISPFFKIIKIFTSNFIKLNEDQFVFR